MSVPDRDSEAIIRKCKKQCDLVNFKSQRIEPVDLFKNLIVFFLEISDMIHHDS